MDILIIIAVVVSLILRVNKNKKAQEEARQKREAALRQAAQTQAQATDPRYPSHTPPKPIQPTVAPVVKPSAPVRRAPDPRFFDTDEDEAALAAAREAERQRRLRAERERQRAAARRPQLVRSAADDEPEGTARPGSLTANVSSSMVTTMENTMATTMLNPQGRRHTLEASSATGHAHMETSMTGLQSDAECPAEPWSEAHGAPSYTFGTRGLSFDREAVVSGILYSEILGKPKALRRRA